MLKKNITYIDTLRSGCHSLASNEEGSIVVEMGFCSIVFGLLYTGMIGFGSFFSQELIADLDEAKALLGELG